MSREARDSQRSKVYTAEGAIRGMGETLPQVDDMQAYVDRLVKYAWFRRRYPAVNKINVRDGRGQRNAIAKWGNIIAMPKWSRREPIVLHEVAHHCTDSVYGKRGVAAHGWQFAATFLELVRYAMGEEAAKALRASYREHKVRYAEPRKGKTLTEAQRKEAVDRLTAARERTEAARPLRALVVVPKVKYGRYLSPGDEAYVVGCKTKKEAADLLGIGYNTVVRDSEWFEPGTGAPGLRIAVKSVDEGSVKTFYRSRERNTWHEGQGDGLDTLRSLMSF